MWKSVALVSVLVSVAKSSSADISGVAYATEPWEATFNIDLDGQEGGDQATFTVRVHPDWAPEGAKRFQDMVHSGSVLTGARFFRVVPNFMVQFGIPGNPTVAGEWRQKTIPDDKVLKGNRIGRMTFATAGPNTRTTQLFINTADNSFLDNQGFAPFAEVLGDGMDVVNQIQSKYRERPNQGAIQSMGNSYLQKEPSGKTPGGSAISKSNLRFFPDDHLGEWSSPLRVARWHQSSSERHAKAAETDGNSEYDVPRTSDESAAGEDLEGPIFPARATTHLEEGQLVKIRDCDHQEVARLFDAAGTHWNPRMAACLGSGGTVEHAGFPDRRVRVVPHEGRAWTWPVAMLKPLDCRCGRKIIKTHVIPPGHVCDACQRDFDEEPLVAWRCPACDFDLCESCASKKAALFVGQHVKVRSLPVHEARRLCRGVAGWVDSMTSVLGAVGEIENIEADHCDMRFHLDDGSSRRVSWVFGLLEYLQCPRNHDFQPKVLIHGEETTACKRCGEQIEHHRRFYCCASCDYDLCQTCAGRPTRPPDEPEGNLQVGDRVRALREIRESGARVQPGTLGTILYSAADDDEVQIRWDNGYQNNGLRRGQDFQRVLPHITVGSVVRVRDAVSSPTHGWGHVQRGERGRVREIDGRSLVIDFPSHSGWNAEMGEVELCEDEATDTATLSTEDFQRGMRVRCIRDDVAADWSGCPPQRLHFSYGTVFTIGEIQGRFFRPREFESLWAPLSAVRPAAGAEAGRRGGRIRAETDGQESQVRSGHDEEWLDAEAAQVFNCPICMLVCRQALMHSCRVITCESCWQSSTAQDPRCPVCRQDGEPAVAAYEKRWEIDKLELKCPNGCGEHVVLKDKVAHMVSIQALDAHRAEEQA
ncbi:ppi1 [Symbiodinium natans]|uniref:Ppi1 protein n=1 Tax=Symbiodinium natans TaxID=878477 RepID=A0A812KHK0_9DINO|nr:ppi1 [Symbiodinium natans]